MYLSDLGEQFHHARVVPSLIHCDTAAAGRSSTAVITTVSDHLRREAERGSYLAAADRHDDYARDTTALASLIGHSADDITFVDSARSALNTLLNGWNVPSGGTVWVAANEFGPNLAEFTRRGYDVQPLPSDHHGRVDVEAMTRALQVDTPDVIHLCHVGSKSGIVQPAAQIVAAAHAANVPVVIDMAQSAGHVPTVTGADAVYGTSRKWLTGPRGIGFLAVGAHALLSADIERSDAFPAGRLGLGAAVTALAHMGPDLVYRELAAIGQATRQRLDGVGGWRSCEPLDEKSALVTLAPPPGWRPSDVHVARDRLLDEQAILVTAADSWRAPLSADGSVLRVSAHLDLRKDDLDRLADALGALALG